MKINELTFLNKQTKIVIIGEAGSGKSEISMNLAALIKQNVNQEVCFFDMDQTKPLFRSRDVGDALRRKGVIFRVQQQFMDAPVVPYGVIESLKDKGSWTILDVGGSQAGALCIGQFADTILEVNARVYYLINPYRSFADTTGRIRQTMNSILACSHLSEIHIISNPYLGSYTTLEQLLEGNDRLAKLLKPLDKEISLTAIPLHLWDEARNKISGNVICINPYISQVLS